MLQFYSYFHAKSFPKVNMFYKWTPFISPDNKGKIPMNIEVFHIFIDNSDVNWTNFLCESEWSRFKGFCFIMNDNILFRHYVIIFIRLNNIVCNCNFFLYWSHELLTKNIIIRHNDIILHLFPFCWKCYRYVK